MLCDWTDRGCLEACIVASMLCSRCLLEQCAMHLLALWFPLLSFLTFHCNKPELVTRLYAEFSDSFQRPTVPEVVLGPLTLLRWQLLQQLKVMRPKLEQQ